MRIIAGSCRGRKLKAVEGLKVRPTADKVKEAVFSAVNAYIYDCEFLGGEQRRERSGNFGKRPRCAKNYH